MRRSFVVANILLFALCVGVLIQVVPKKASAQDESSMMSPKRRMGDRLASQAQLGAARRWLRWATGRVVSEEEVDRMANGLPVADRAQGTNTRVNESGPAAETTIIIDPTNPDHLIAAAMDSSTAAVRATPYVSFDAGQSWQQGRPVSNFVRAPDGTVGMFQNQSDPVLAADGRGNTYLATIMWGTNTDDNGVYVFRSTDGGRRFARGVPVVTHIDERDPAFEDKEWVTVDTTGGPFSDSLYITWSSFPRLPEPRRILFSRSLDRGETFSAPVAINDDRTGNSGVQGSMPQVGPGGEIYVIWLHFRPNSTELLMDKSTDGGMTFGTDTLVATVTGFGRLRGLPRNGGSLPTLAVDRSSGPHRGNLYAIWADGRNGDVDIFLARSTDDGASWAAPLRVNDDRLANGKDQFMPFVTVDQTSGDVVVGYYDRRDSLENFLVDYRVAWSSDGGRTFVPSTKLTDEAFEPSAAFRFIRAAGTSVVCQFPFMGDYTSLTAAGGLLYPLWADTRNGRSDLFTQPVQFR